MKSLRLEAIRNIALMRETASVDDVVSILSLDPTMSRRIVNFAWAGLAHRTLMSLLPSFENLRTYNERRRAVQRVIQDRGLEERISADEVEELIDLGSRVLEHRAGARKSSWSDLHYSTRREILLRQKHRCVTCGVRLRLGEPGYEDSPELDHIVPFAMRGNIESNTRVICKRCNVAKHDHLTYITQGRMAFSDTTKSDDINMNRLLYWAVELAQSHCEMEGCINSSLDTQLHIVKRASLISWNIDNSRVACAVCSEGKTRFPL